MPSVVTLSAMETRHARIRRLRTRVVAGAAGVFLVALGGVAALGRQPATKVTHASTPTNDTATRTQTYDDDGYDDDGGGTSSQTYAPAPMTSRSS